MLVNLWFLKTINKEYRFNVGSKLTSYSDLVNEIETKDDLISVIKCLDKYEILLLNEGIIRLLSTWERLYLEKLNSYLKKYNIYTEDYLLLDNGTVNELRRFIRNKDYEQLIITHTQVYFDRLNKVLQRFDKSNLFLPAIKNEIRIKSLLELENALYS